MNVHQCIAVLLVSGSFALAVTQPEDQNEPPPFRKASLEAVLDRLPLADAEWPADPTTGLKTEHPAVMELGRRLDRGARLTDEQWKRALSNTEAIRVNETVTAGEPLVVESACPGGWGRP